MHFSHIINAALSNEPDRPLMQKDVYAVSNAFQQYLQHYGRDVPIPLAYSHLLQYRYTNPIRDEHGRHTHWENVVYQPAQQAILQKQLAAVYKLLMRPDNDNFHITAIDFCEYANSMPFRATVEDGENGITSFFYIKSPDASRIYGLELEHLVTGNPVHFLYHQNTLIESHISGTPGDDFITAINQLSVLHQHELAKAFIRFNESSFARLLGDMRSYNFVITGNGELCDPFHIRSIDFDQQCYEGRLNLYLPQFYKENMSYVKLVYQCCQAEEIEQHRLQHRQCMATHAAANRDRLQTLLQVMSAETLSEPYKVLSLRKELNEYFKTNEFNNCNSMGALVQQQLHQVLNW